MYLIALSIILLVLSVIFGVDYTDNVLRWMIIGEKVSTGGILYKDILTTESPLFSWFISLLSTVSFRSTWLNASLGTLLVFLYGLHLNGTINRFKLLKNRSYVPLLLFILFFFLHPDLIYVSPTLLGCGFIVLAFRSLLNLAQGDAHQEAFNIGFLVGLAMLCSNLYLFCLVVAIFGLLYFTSPTARTFGLFFIGVVIPFAVVAVLLLVLDSWGSFYGLYVSNYFRQTSIIKINWIQMGLIWVLPILVLVFSVLAGVNGIGLSNFVQKSRQLLAIWWLLALLNLGLAFYAPSVQMLIVLVIPFTIFLSNIFISSRRGFLMEVLLLLVFVPSVALSYYWDGGVIRNNNLEDDTSAQTCDSFLPVENNNSVYKAGAHLGKYRGSKHGTAWVDPFEVIGEYNFDSPDAIISVYHRFLKDKPEFVVDNEEGRIKKLFEKIPLLKRQYEKVGNNCYRLKVKKSTSN